VLAIEEFDFEDVARLRALDRHRPRERVDGIEAHVRNVLNGGLDVDLAIDRVAALEPDDVAGFDGQNRVEAVVPRAVDVLVAITQSVVNRVLALVV
jgi:hypothetical protein